MEQFNKKPKERRKIVSIVIFLIIIGIFMYWAATEVNQWWKVRKEYIRMGLASDKFPYRMYTERELYEMGRWVGESQELNAVPTRTTPEETYAIFRQALIDEDFDKAAECFVKEKQAEYKEAILKAKEEGRLNDIIKKLTDISPRGERIVKGSTGSATASYEILYKEVGNEKFTSHAIIFYKDWNGDWKMDDL